MSSRLRLAQPKTSFEMPIERPVRTCRSTLCRVSGYGFLQPVATVISKNAGVGMARVIRCVEGIALDALRDAAHDQSWHERVGAASGGWS